MRGERRRPVASLGARRRVARPGDDAARVAPGNQIRLV